MTDTDTKSLILWKSSLGFTSTNKEKEFFEETQPFNNYVIGDDIFADSIPPAFEESANTIQFTSSVSGTLDVTGTVCRLENVELTLIPQSDSDSTSGAWTAKDNAGNIILTDSIQFNTNQVGSSQPYEYRLYNGDVRITPAEGSWVFDVKSGIVKFYGEYASPITSLKITCYKYVGQKGIKSTILDTSTAFSEGLKHTVYFAPEMSNYDLTGNSQVTLHNTFDYLKGGVNDGIRFPDNSIPNNFSLITVSRYGGSTKKRIFDAVNSNWLHAHWAGRTGVSYYNKWQTNADEDATGYTDGDWLIMGGKNVQGTGFQTIDGNNNIGVANASISGGNYQLSINDGESTEKGDWEVREVLIWNDHLTRDEFSEAYLNLNLKLKPEDMRNNSEWTLSTEVSQGDLINNPWSGEGEEGAPPVEVPLHTLSSNNNGTDLEIKIEFDIPEYIVVESDLTDSSDDYPLRENWGGVYTLSTFQNNRPSYTNGSKVIVYEVVGEWGPTNLLGGSAGWVMGGGGGHRVAIAGENSMYPPLNTNWVKRDSMITYGSFFRVTDIKNKKNTRFYKGWRLNEVFDYLSVGSFSTSVTSYAKFSEDGEWYANNQATGGGGSTNTGWNWSFCADNNLGDQTVSQSEFESSGMSGVIHHRNVGFLLHGNGYQGQSTTDLPHGIYAGADENSSSLYFNYTSWSKIRVYARNVWTLSTELSQGDPINNPWTGVCETNAPPVLVPLHTLSNNDGRDLEIKIEWDNNGSHYSSDGNYDITFPDSVNARYVKLYVEDWFEYISLRMDVYVDGVIQDTPENKRSYSSLYNNEQPGHGHTQSRLGSVQAWSAQTLDTNQWIQLDLESVKNVTGVKVLPRVASNQRVTQFRLEYSENGHTWTQLPGEISTRFYKGWPLNYVFDYTLGDGGDVYNPSSNITVYGKWSEDDDWYKSTQKVRSNNAHCNWNFQGGNGNLLGSTDTMTGIIGHHSLGFILHGITGNTETAYSIYSGTDENHTGDRYNNHSTWSKVRVYARRVEFPRQENMVGWYHASTFPLTGTSTDSTEWPNSAPNVNKLAAATVTKGTVTKVSNGVSNDGLKLNRSLIQYASLDETNIGGTLTFAVWYNMHSESGDDYPRLFQFDDGTQPTNNSNALAIWKDGGNWDAAEFLGTNGNHELLATAPAYDTWNHIVWVINANGSREMYINGTLVASLTLTRDAPTKMVRTTNYIGQRGNLDRGFDGQIKSLNIWERALSADEISKLYDQGRNYSVIIRPPATASNNQLYLDNSTKTFLIYNNGWNKIKQNVFIQSEQPTLDVEDGDLWVDNVNNVVYIQDSLSWKLFSINQTKIEQKVNIHNSRFTGNPKAPITTTDSDSIATKSHVINKILDVVGNAPDELNTLAEISRSINNESNFTSNVITAINDKITINNPQIQVVDESGSIGFPTTVTGLKKSHIGLSDVGNHIYDPTDSTHFSTAHTALQSILDDTFDNSTTDFQFTGDLGLTKSDFDNLDLVENKNKSDQFANRSLEGVPTVPDIGTSPGSTQVINVNYVNTRITEILDNVPTSFDTLEKISAYIGNDSNLSGTVNSQLDNTWNSTYSKYDFNNEDLVMNRFYTGSTIPTELINYKINSSNITLTGDLILSPFNINIEGAVRVNSLTVRHLKKTSSGNLVIRGTTFKNNEIDVGNNNVHVRGTITGNLGSTNTIPADKLTGTFNNDQLPTIPVSKFDTSMYHNYPQYSIVAWYGYGGSYRNDTGYHDFSFPTSAYINARYVKLYVEDWHKHISLRMDVYVDGAIQDTAENKRTYSSRYNNDAVGTGHARSRLDSSQAWSAKHNNTNQWIQLDLGSAKTVTGVKVIQRKNYDQYVKQFRIECSEDGSNWREPGIPDGWRFCNGHYGTPNLNDRFIMGVGDTYGINSTGGSKTHTLTTAQMPQHNHGKVRDKYFKDTYKVNRDNYDSWDPGSPHSVQHTSDSSNGETRNSGYTGGGQAYSIMPSYRYVFYIMKTT